MPRLHFANLDLDMGEVVEALPRLSVIAGLRLPSPARTISHRQPTRQPDDGPVLDCEGLTKWRVAVAGADEVTCLECGETYPKRWKGCPRCNGDDSSTKMKQTKTVPTLSYLRPGEYELK